MVDRAKMDPAAVAALSDLARGIAQDGIEDVAIGIHAIAPEIMPHQTPRMVQLGNRPGQGHGQMADQVEVLKGNGLGLDEGLEDARRQPGILFDQRFAHTDHMHDREDF